MKIIAAHLLNDYTGSPKVLSQLVNGWTTNNLDVQLFINRNSEGFLNHTSSKKHYFNYTWSANKLLTLLRFMGSQTSLFIKTLRLAKKEDVVYINTVLPAGVALAAKLKGSKVIYHIHETSVKPELLKRILFKVVDFTHTKAIYVSNYLRNTESEINTKSTVIYNSLNQDFLQKAMENRTLRTELKNILMVCSHKAYKGIYEFVELAKANSNLSFSLVLSTTKQGIAKDKKLATLPENLTIYPLQKNLHPFYKKADLIMNLSKPDQWIETFGLTILEGMAYGCPAIIPNTGGITELVENGYNGYSVNPSDIHQISVLLQHLRNNRHTFNKLQTNALDKLLSFSEDKQIQQTLELMK
jgi:glycosyltransferase involved in cell wall biosynthesis